MADQKISQLPDAGAPQATDQMPLARSGSTLSLLWSSVLSALNLGTAATHAATDFDAAGDAATAQANAETYADGKVASVAAGDTSIVVGGSATAPTLETATLDVIATDHPPAAAWSNNSKKITSVANGSAAQDAAAFGQIPTALPPNGSAGGDLSGTYPNPAVAKITETSGPTDLTIGTITDGQYLKRTGSTLVSGAPPGGVSSVFTRTGAVVAVNGDYNGVVAAALTGATAATRYVGATTSGAPASGTFAVGDFVVTQNGHIFVCTVAGTPGTWVDVGSAGNLVTSVFGRTGAVAAASNDYNLNQIGSATGDYSINSHKLTSVTDPTNAQDAATKHYVDAAVPGNAGGKGHLTTATAVNTPADLAPGTDGTVLKADSTQSTGLIWTAASNVQVFAAGAGQSWSKPTGCVAVEVICIGSGGQGGGGWNGTGAASGSGGCGGGGGAVSRAVFQASDVSSPQTVTVGAGGSGAGAPGNPGATGGDGANTTFGALLVAGGGGGGLGGTSGTSKAGGAGGSVNASAVNVTAPTFSASPGVGGQAAKQGTSGGVGVNAEWGGASGGGSTSGGTGKNGMGSIFGGPSGAGGGGTTSTVGQNTGAGGTTQSYDGIGGGGGSQGTSGGTTTKGGDGSSFVGPFCGAGGGGGGAGSTGVTGKNGGAGGIGAGGGGGGSSANTTAGTGGVGGDGRCIVIAHF